MNAAVFAMKTAVNVAVTGGDSSSGANRIMLSPNVSRMRVVPLLAAVLAFFAGCSIVVASDASHELALHTAVSVRVPALHDMVPERV